MEKPRIWPTVRVMVEILGWLFVLILAGCVGALVFA